ncbi:hypothetical protein BKI52_23710 [marine bacterium AO1-C]|nr:hypothetical protein BKI52_23710 [marine bacterium AO1-C]
MGKDSGQKDITLRFIEVYKHLADVNPLYQNKSEFARQMNEHVQTLNAVLNGRRETSITFLNKLFHSFKVNPLYIFFGKGNMLLPESNEFEDDNEREIKRLATLVKGLEKDVENFRIVIAAKDETISAQKRENNTLTEQIKLLKQSVKVKQ